MSFPLDITATVDSAAGPLTRTLTLNTGLSVLLGANGSGKTQLLRALRTPLEKHAQGRHVRFLSAGRMGLAEQYRSDFDGQRGGKPNYEKARYGSKSDSARRHRVETIMGDFQTIAARAGIRIKIQARFHKLFKRDFVVDWDERGLQISFVRLENYALPYSSAREASGLLNLVGILAGLYDDEVGAMLIDEPEVSLHPQLQAFLLKEMLSASGDPASGKKIIVIATHSTEMLRVTGPEDLCSLIFCYDIRSQPVQLSPSAEELKNKKLCGLIARLGHEHKLSLFSKRPLLVEGPSDVTICNALAARADIHLDAAGSQLLPVVGKGDMPIIVKLLRLLGKEPIVLVDADAVADGTDLVSHLVEKNSIANDSAQRQGFASANEMAKSIIGDFYEIVSRKWIDIESLASQHYFWVTKTDSDQLRAKRRSALCVILSADLQQLKELDSEHAWHVIATRFRALLDLLEGAGLFVLRKGTIESYFVHTVDDTSRGKPATAIQETEAIAIHEETGLTVAYGDVYRCLRFASATENIREAEAIQDLLLSVVAPIQGRWKAGTETQDPNVVARSILGDRSRIFDMSVTDGILTVGLNSKILSVSGFPLTICPNDDVVRRIRESLEGDL